MPDFSQEARWVEVSLTLNSEMAEAVAEVMARFVSNGVVVESGVEYKNDEDEGTPVGAVKVYGYIPVDEHLEENRQRLTEGLWHIGQIQPIPEPAFRTIADQDWMAAWKEHYHPIPVGKKILILPAWINQEDPQRIPVRIDPGMAFGTGTHPSTQLCLEMLETYTQPGVNVIDVGCGSGILSIAALKLGASHALGVDIDAAAVKSTRDNAGINDILTGLETGRGSVEEVLKGDFSILSAPLVLANILAPVIIRLFDAGLAQLVTPGGTLILAGILAEQGDGVRAAAEKQGLVNLETRRIEDWVSIALRKG